MATLVPPLSRTASLSPTFPADFPARCAAAIDEALGQVRAYRAWRRFDLGSAAPIDERYAGLPALGKRWMNAHGPAAFVTPGHSLEAGVLRGEIELVKTSGTTDEQVSNVWFQPWWDASERASWTLNAHAAAVATGQHREAILSSPLCVGPRSERGDLTFEQRRTGRFLFLNDLVDPLSWSDGHCERMLDELARFEPAVLEANPSLLSRLCRTLLRTGRDVFRPALIVLTYELPSAIHRRHIQAVFGAPIMSSYGTTESAYVFIECEHGRLHQNTRFCRVDLVPFGTDQGGPSLGLLLVTTFDNPWRSLIRFDVGDVARLPPAEPCPCGRTDGLTLASIEGRTANLTTTPEGLPVTQAEVDRRLACIGAIDEYQLRQTDEHSYRVEIACDGGYSSAVAASAEDILHGLYGPQARISVEEGRRLSPEPSGKYRLVRAMVPIDWKLFVDPRHRPPALPAWQPRLQRD